MEPQMDYLLFLVRASYTCRRLRHRLLWAGFSAPGQLSAMYLSEPPQYVAAAILAVNTRGE
jgi:hypothetical protein